MSESTNGLNRHEPPSSLFQPPALLVKKQVLLERAWDKLDQAIEEIEDKDRIIRRLKDDLRKSGRTGKTAPALDPSEIGILVSEVERERIRWVWPGRLAQGKLTILDGDPGLGKSTLLYDLAARITTGRAMPDGTFAPQGGVLILSTEDGLADTIRPRLEAAGAELSRCLVVQTLPEPEGPGRAPVLPNDLTLLEHGARRVEARLMIIDPLMAHLGSETNTHRDQDVRRALSPLTAFAEAWGLSVVVVRHLNKMSGGSALYRGGGSIGIIGAARVGLLVGRHPQEEEQLVLACTKNNLARMPGSLAFRLEDAPADPETSRVVWEGPCPLGASDLLSTVEKSSSATNEAALWLEEMLAEGPRPAAELYEAAEGMGIGKRVLQKARNRVADTERVGGISGKGAWMWQLKMPKVPTKIP